MKKIGKILIALICIFALSTKVKAIYNGSASGGKGNTAPASSKCGKKQNCNYDNMNVGPILKAQLFYIDNGNYTPMSDTYYYYSSSANVALIKKYITDNHPEESVKDDPSAGYQHLVPLLTVNISGWKNGNFDYEPARKQLLAYFGNDNNDDLTNLSNANLRNFLYNVFGVSNNTDLGIAMSRESQVANPEAAASYGYRIIIEPVVTYQNASWNNGHNGNATPHEMASYLRSGAKINSCSFPFSNAKKCSNTKSTALRQTVAFYTDFKDVGIESRSYDSCKNISPNDLTDTVGCAMNIVDVGKHIETKKCYKRVQNGNIECKNIDSINSGTFTEKYEEVQCDGLKDDEKTNSQYGKQIAKSGKCILYGIESGDVHLPGGISTSNTTYAVNSKHTYFAWPSTNENTGMPAIIRNTVAFKLVNTGGSGACSQAEINDLTAAAKNALEKSTFELKLTGGDFQPINGELLTAKKDPLIGNVNISTSSFAGNVSSEFSLSKRAYMIIPENKNRIFNTITGNVSDGTVANESRGERDRKQGVVSLAVDSTLGKKWKLKLSGLKFGINGDLKPEVDHYECEITTHEPCFCPSKYVQKNLDDMVAEGRTCTQAQTAAIEAGECDEFCESKYNGSKVKITDCVIDEMYKNGNDLNKAIEACIDKTPECKLKKYCQTSAGVEIPEKQYEDCINSISGKTRAEKELICDDKLCGCVVNGKTPQEYINCIDNGGSRNYCTFAYCDKQNVCKQCLYCTTNCHWYDENDLQSDQTILVKKCDNGDPKDIDCGHRYITNKSCLLNKLGVSNLKNALETNKITVRDLDDAIEKCNFDNTNISVSRDNLVMRTISLDDPFYSTSEKTYEKALGKFYSNTGNPSRYPSEPFSDPKVVEKTILKARGAKGDDLYKLAPVLEITINPKQMTNIKEYNKTNSLSDFKLECAEGNNYCHSKFLDDENLVTITKDTQKSKCGGIDTSTKAGFKKCYESNN